jgi:hypothetical protein
MPACAGGNTDLTYSSHEAGGAVEARAQSFFEGAGAPRPVDLRLGDTLQIFEAGAFRAAWGLADVRRASGASGPLRIRALTASPRAWCEISDPAFAAAIAQRCHLLDGDRQEKREALWRVAALATTGLVVIAALVWFVIPALADRFAPLVPVSIEAQFGAAADADRGAIDHGGDAQRAEPGHFWRHQRDDVRGGRLCVLRMFRRTEFDEHMFVRQDRAEISAAQRSEGGVKGKLIQHARRPSIRTGERQIRRGLRPRRARRGGRSACGAVH